MEAAIGRTWFHRIVAAIAAALVAAAAAALLAAGGPGADLARAGSPPAPLDHFYCYKAKFEPRTAVGAQITLQDQFFLSQGAIEHTVGRPKWFCNPTLKQHGSQTFPIANENNHLTAYQLNGKTPKERLHVVNQFQSPDPRDPPNLVTDPDDFGTPNKPLILVPTRKFPHQEPAGLDHFKCYEAERRSKLEVPIQLSDQFGSRQTKVGRAEFLCNPAQKVHNTTTVPVTNPDGHLVCYSLKSFKFPDDQRPSAQISNQFGSWGLAAKVTYVLCVPSQKFHVSR